MPTLLNKFLGTERWKELQSAFREESELSVGPQINNTGILVALVLAALPIGLTILDESRTPNTPASMLPTLAFGVCAVLAGVLRSRLGLAVRARRSFKKTLSLSHTAVALGCIPAVLILALTPTLLAERHETISSAVGVAGSSGARPSLVELSLYLLAVSAWVAATEELLFRGLLLSTIRRGSLPGTQRQRDIAAILFTALIFGFAHWATWGLVPALALFGLGIGFGLAYVANGEQLFPLMLYHFVFDFASMAISLTL